MAKSKCNHCDQNIEFDDSMIGNDVTCPSCGKNTKLLLSTEESAPESLAPYIKHHQQKLQVVMNEAQGVINEADGWFNKALLKGTNFFAKALFGVGMFWFIGFFISWAEKSRLASRFPEATSEAKELIIENIFAQCQMGLLIAGIGILIIEVRKLQVNKGRKSE